MTSPTIAADKEVDALYGGMRSRHGNERARANGYVSQSYFEREQRMVLSLIDADSTPIVDIAGGSGLMLAPLRATGKQVLVVDFNEDACAAARHNSMYSVRGDAYALPFSDSSIAQTINCQFLNQQSVETEEAFVGEIARVLRPGGRSIIVWRHAQSLLHRGANAVFETRDRILGRPIFPQVSHPMDRMIEHARTAGLNIRQNFVAIPFFRDVTVGPKHPLGWIVGGSLVLVIEKPDQERASTLKQQQTGV